MKLLVLTVAGIILTPLPPASGNIRLENPVSAKVSVKKISEDDKIHTDIEREVL